MATIDITREKPVRLTEIAELFGVHERTVTRWADPNHVPRLEAVRIGGTQFTTREAVQRFVDACAAAEHPKRKRRRRKSGGEAESGGEKDATPAPDAALPETTPEPASDQESAGCAAWL